MKMTREQRSSLVLALAGAVFGLLVALLIVQSMGCRTPRPEWVGEVIDCGSDVVRKCGPGALAPVNGCLSSDGDWKGCLTNLIRPTICGAEVVIACVVRDRGQVAAAATQLNPDDTLSARRADRASEWIQERGYKWK